MISFLLVEKTQTTHSARQSLNSIAITSMYIEMPLMSWGVELRVPDVNH